MKKIIDPFFLLTLLSQIVWAQVPTISDFNPKSGPVISTTVTITGTNFSITAANNIVYFGAVKATVTAATLTSLNVTVPTGATYQPITVTNVATGLTAYSAKPFLVTFSGGGSITSSSFAKKFDFAVGNDTEGSQFIAIGDIDGDGKPDLAVTNSHSKAVCVFRNTSISGNITGSSFAASINFTTGDNPWGVAIGDLDGDGKLDLVVTNVNSNTVSVFRNTSTSGSISFAAKVDFAAGIAPIEVAIGDLDGDGKPDLAVANSGGAVSVFRNTGTINSISFAEKVDFPTGDGPLGIAINDLDGDGKPDITVANSGHDNGTGISISVFHNTSTVGSISNSSFATKIDFTTASNPCGLTIGDFDGDGKSDIAVSILASNGTVSIFQNTSTSGNISSSSFNAKVDFTANNSPWGIAIDDLDGDGKPDLAVSNTNSNGTVSVFRNTTVNGSITSNSFAPKVDFATFGYCHDVAIGDLDGDGKPDLAITNYLGNTISVLRNTIAVPAGPITGWSLQTNPLGSNTLGKIQFVSSTEGWISEAYGRLLHTTDAGANWTVVTPFPSDTVVSMSDPAITMWWVNQTHGWKINMFGTDNFFNDAHGAVIHKTTDGGNTWQRKVLSTSVGDAGIQVQFVDENNGWALIHNFSSGNGSCLRTTDGGNNWSTIGTAGIFYFVDVNNGWAIGSPNIYHTTNGGTDWSVQYTDATPGGFKTIQFTDLDNGWIVGDSSKILKTTNGGSNWMQIANTVSGIKYKGLFFLDANIGWIGGPISGHMPGLLLYTSNGGSSWTTQSFPMDNEDNVWSIFFWDANNGWFTSDGGKIGHTTNSGSTGVEEGNKSIPSGNSLSQNYPNPFNPSTNISFKLTKLSFVSLKIFDLLGREVATIVSEQLSTGNHVRQWNAMNMPSGVYFYRLQSDSFTETKKLILLK